VDVADGYPDFAQWLIELGVQSISLQQDAVVPFLTRRNKQHQQPLLTI
jgi:hypothetical protein